MSVLCDSDGFGICCKNGYILHIFCPAAQIYTLVLGESILLFNHSLMSDSLRPHGLQNARPPCPSPTPRACSNSCPLSQPSHLLSSPFPPVFNLSHHQGLSSELVLCIRWPKYCSFSFSISPSNEYLGLISFRIE